MDMPHVLLCCLQLMAGKKNLLQMVSAITNRSSSYVAKRKKQRTSSNVPLWYKSLFPCSSLCNFLSSLFIANCC